MAGQDGRTSAVIQPQGLMFSRNIEDMEFEAALGTIKDSREDFAFRQQHRALAKAKKVARRKMEIYGINDGEWVQVGHLALCAKELAGGGFELAEWTSMSVGEIASAS